MQIDKIFFPVTTLGYGKRLGIWTIGCPHHCKGCSNPELWESSTDKNVDISIMISIAESKKTELDGVTITGGEPFVQYLELKKLVEGLNNIGINDILIYSGYLKKEIDDIGYSNIFQYIAALADGKYVEEINTNIGLTGSENQDIYIFNSYYKDRYTNFKTQKRKTQNIISNGVIHSLGLPIKNSLN